MKSGRKLLGFPTDQKGKVTGTIPLQKEPKRVVHFSRNKDPGK